MKKISKIISLVTAPFFITLPQISSAATAGCFNSVINGQEVCNYNDWIKIVWVWGTGIAVSLSVIVIIFAGVVWMTSAGNPDAITRSKKMILGAISGLALLILARIFLTVLGLGDLWIFPA